MSVMETEDWTERLVAHGAEVLELAFQCYYPRLEALVRFRMSGALSSRLDPEDVLQESFLVINQRLEEFRERPAVSAFVWMRQLTLQKLVDLQRHHFGQKRDPQKEQHRRDYSAALSITRYLESQHTSPTGVARRNEELEKLREALLTMSETDQEIVAMRHFEQMSNRETAESLGISEKAASNRYVRALAQLKKIMNLPGQS